MLRNEAARVHPALKAPVREIEDSLEYAYAPFRFLAAAGLIAALALVLPSVGLYGVVSLAVSQRTHEIGIRMALGARSSDVMRTVFRSSLRLVAIGVGVGRAEGLLLRSSGPRTDRHQAIGLGCLRFDISPNGVSRGLGDLGARGGPLAWIRWLR
jgi:hypothetical protein